MSYTEIMNIVTPFAVLVITAFGIVIWSIVQEMKNELKQIAEVAYSARANNQLSEERRKNVEDKLDKTVELLEKLNSKFEEMQRELNNMKIEAAAQRKTTPCKRTNQ